MASKENWDDLTDKQQDILETAKKNPDYSAEEIAVETDSSASYVRDVRKEYEGEVKKTGSGADVGFLVIIILAVVIVHEMGLI
jgi:cytochrome b involved in lipid metabolism